VLHQDNQNQNLNLIMVSYIERRLWDWWV